MAIGYLRLTLVLDLGEVHLLDLVEVRIFPIGYLHLLDLGDL